MTQPDDMEGIKTQLYDLTMTAQEAGIKTQLSQLSINAQEDGVENHFSDLTINAQDPAEYLMNQAIPEATLAENWVRIFEHYHPTQMHVLTQHRHSNQRLITYLRAWFAFSELHDFSNLDAIANDPHMMAFHGFLRTDATFEGETDTKIDNSNRTYTSFEEWFANDQKPEGYMFDENTNQMVAYTSWHENQAATAQNLQQDMHAWIAQPDGHDGQTAQLDADVKYISFE
jgi:hypothetical protein